MFRFCLGFEYKTEIRKNSKGVSRILTRRYSSHNTLFDWLISPNDERWANVRHAFLSRQSFYCILESKLQWLIKRIPNVNDPIRWYRFNSVKILRRHRTQHLTSLPCQLFLTKPHYKGRLWPKYTITDRIVTDKLYAGEAYTVAAVAAESPIWDRCHSIAILPPPPLVSVHSPAGIFKERVGMFSDEIYPSRFSARADHWQWLMWIVPNDLSRHLLFCVSLPR